MSGCKVRMLQHDGVKLVAYDDVVNAIKNQESSLPINRDIVRKSGEIRNKLAELSYHDTGKAVELLRIWGQHEMPITPFYDLLIQTLAKQPKESA